MVVVSNFAALKVHLEDIMVRGPPQGYFHEPTKIILVVSENNGMQAEAYFQGMGIKVVTRSCYIGVFIGD